MPIKVKVKVTANFKRNLGELESFHEQKAELALFDLFLDELSQTLIPNLERFPALGRLFLSRSIQSVEASNRFERLSKKLGKLGSALEIREYVSRAHVILYAVTPACIYLLSVRHQRQISFDFDAMWE